MRPAFKFTRRNYVDMASFRLGTLYDFRCVEKYGLHVGDGTEGTCKGAQESFYYWADFDPHSFLSSQPFSYAYAKGRESDGLMRHILTVTSQDLLVFCASAEFSDDLFDKFDADVCLMIRDFDAFADSLVSAIPWPVEKHLVCGCSYLEKDFFSACRSVPALPYWKESEYRHQNEIRLCVSVAHDPIEPISIISPAALNYCDLIGRMPKRGPSRR